MRKAPWKFWEKGKSHSVFFLRREEEYQRYESWVTDVTVDAKALRGVITTRTRPMDKKGEGRDFGFKDPIKGMPVPSPKRLDKLAGLLNICRCCDSPAEKCLTRFIMNWIELSELKQW